MCPSIADDCYRYFKETCREGTPFFGGLLRENLTQALSRQVTLDIESRSAVIPSGYSSTKFPDRSGLTVGYGCGPSWRDIDKGPGLSASALDTLQAAMLSRGGKIATKKLPMELQKIMLEETF